MASALASLSSVAVSGIVIAKLNSVGPSIPNSSASKLVALPSLCSKNLAHKNSRGKFGAYVAERIFTSTEEETAVEDVEKEEVEAFDSPLIPNIDEIQSLVTEICDDTTISEVQIKIQGFKLRIKRDVGKDSSAPAAAPATGYSAPIYSAPPVPTFPMIDSLSSSPASVPQAPAYESEEEVDEGLQYVIATTVGIFHSGRPRKGKFGRPFVTEGSKVKIGQLVGFIEQLGTNLNVESEHAGEIAEVFVKEGDPIEFGQKLFSIRPSFPGIKKLQ